ncbi:MAG: phage tail protein [Deinococcales bacterium]|jgi:phage tail-like protein
MPDAQDKPTAKVGVTVDPFRNYNFRLEVNEVGEARFTECIGLGLRVHPIRYRESGAGHVVRALPGPVDYGEVTLRYGLTKATNLWQWLLDTANGKIRRSHVSVIMLDLEGSQEAMRWNLINAWPCEWRGAPLDALGREAAIEEMHLVYESLDRS